jgi:hypothetical protein
LGDLLKVVTVLTAPVAVAALLIMVMLVAEVAAVEAPHTGLAGEPVAEAIAEAWATQIATSPAPHTMATMLAAKLKKYDAKSPRQTTTMASPPFSARLRNLLLPEKFKPLGITKYDTKQDPVQWLICYALSIENASGNNDTKCLYFPFCPDQAPLTWLESLDKWDQLKDQFTSNFAVAMGRSGTRMELAMVKQEQGETLRKYMRRFFDKRATVVDVTNKEVIDLFQDGLYHRRTFEDFSCRRLSSITKIKDMITSWADEEDKANAKYDAIRGKSKQNTGGSNNNNNRIKGVATTTTTRVLTASASQTIQSRLSSALRKTTRRRPLAASKTCWKRSARGTWRATTPPSSATNSSEHSRTLQTHCLLTTRRAKKSR